ncbi:uncharacterized protein MONOS_18349 [Monocercomonoides exilis]|uniref:uncharacterized protein n=1 Tax=Monocercomonoides exilis TaxID=2049356 RepID=UPI003559601A|nr:hypothetical protein MONOS_18349 [Monocercomonoides exilis]
MDGLRERERGKSGESERLGEASAAQGLHRWCTALQRSSLLLAFTLRMKCGREGSWGREENEGEREVREGREKRIKKIVWDEGMEREGFGVQGWGEKGEERKVRVRLREREGNGWVERKRERKEWGVREVGRGECCTGAAQMVHSAAALIPLTRLHSANEEKKRRGKKSEGEVEREREMDGLRERERGKSGESERLGEASAAQGLHRWCTALQRSSLLLAFTLRMKRKKGEERKVRVRLREREGNGWVERKRERKEWGVREVGRGECCTGAAQMVHSAVALIPSYSPSLLRMKCGREGSWGREENEGEREVREGREKRIKKNREKGEERKVRVRLREREGNGWVERKRERKEWGVREVGRGECCTGAAQMVHSAVALIPSYSPSLLRMKCGREGVGEERRMREKERLEREEKKRIKKNREKGEERKVRVRLREREGNGWVERKRERKEWGVREVGRGECCTGAAQMEKKGEERKVRVRLREREGNGWVERKRERKEWGVREVGRGECCTGAAQMVHSAAALIPLTRLHSANEEKKGEEKKSEGEVEREREMDGLRERERGKSGESERLGEASAAQGLHRWCTALQRSSLLLAFTLRMKCGREGSWGREENEGEREEKKRRGKKSEGEVEREGNGWVERKRERKEWGVREVGRGECCTGAAQMCGREGSWGREENEGEREVREGREKRIKKIVWDEGMEREGFGVQGWGEKGEERKVRVRLREREGNGWVERKRERKEWGVREVGRGECCTGAAQMVHSAVALIPLLAFTLRMKCGREGVGEERRMREKERLEREEKKRIKKIVWDEGMEREGFGVQGWGEKGEERKVRVRLREREGNGWVERKRERKEWGVREVGRGECCTGAAQMVHSAVALIPLTRLHSANEVWERGSWGREENEGEREVNYKKIGEKGEERKVRVRLREREGNGWVERKRERKEWGVREVGRGECCTGAAQMVHSAVALIPSYSPSLCE